MADKIRLDAYLAEKGILETREKAKAYVLSGYVYVDGRKADKPALPVGEESEITIRHPDTEFVSRGGHKLKKALEEFGIDTQGKTAADFGASTGGFTDCLLQRGAQKVYAVDVGYGQLHWKLRSDPHVAVMERQNARLLKKEQFTDAIDLIVIDASFISLKLLLPVALEILREGGEVVSLIKPQFEAGRGQVGKRGVVRDGAVHVEVIRSVLSFAAGIGFSPAGLTFSPIQGPNGNIEYLAYFLKNRPSGDAPDAQNIVKSAQDYFKTADF